MNKLFMALCVAGMMSGGDAWAQKQMFSGKVTDASGAPVAGARIKVNKNYDLAYETQADQDGLYNTTLLAEGAYNIDVIANGKSMKARRIMLEHKKRYYNLHMGDKRLTVEATDTDPFMATKMTNIANDDRNRILAPNAQLTRMDTIGKVTHRYEKPIAKPMMK